jgi:hypothetical protein
MSNLIFKPIFLRAILAIVGTFAGLCAYADTIVEDNFMVSMSSIPRVEALGQSAPGRWTVTVTDLVWPQALASLSFTLTDFSQVLASHDGSGTLIFDVLAPTTLFATVYASPNAAAGMGVYHINVGFTPAVPQVPLPAAGWLLLSGMSAFAAVRRKHATVTNSVVQ